MHVCSREEYNSKCSYWSWGFKGIVPIPSDAGVAGEIGVIGPPGLGVGGYKLAVLEGGITGFGVAPKPKLLIAGDIIGLCNIQNKLTGVKLIKKY